MKKILIVDDQAQIRELVAITLQVDDYEPLFAENGQEAIEVAQTKQPDLILLDVTLLGSDLNGLEVCRRLKKNPATKTIPIVLLTGRGQQSDFAAGKAAGADHYFTKPFSPIALVKKIKTILG